jgi:hypothetical protein
LSEDASGGWILLSRLLAASFVVAMVTMAHRASLESTSATTTYRGIPVDGVTIFYREAGVSSAPTIVLLHGFQSSSREFDSLVRPNSDRRGLRVTLSYRE